MIELRLVEEDGIGQFQQRTRMPVFDASGSMCGFGPWSEWRTVPVVTGIWILDDDQIPSESP